MIIAKTSGSFNFSLTGIGILDIPKPTATACGLSFGNKVIFEVIINRYNKNKNSMKKIKLLLNFSINYTDNVDGR